MDHGGRCFNLHGHSYLYEIQLETKVGHIGYGIDFADVKTLLQYYIDGYLDHGAILNPADFDIIDLCRKIGSKYHIMSLVDTTDKYMNPSAENIAREMYFTLHALFTKNNIEGYERIHNIRLYETPNCYVDYGIWDDNLYNQFCDSETVSTLLKFA